MWTAIVVALCWSVLAHEVFVMGWVPALLVGALVIVGTSALWELRWLLARAHYRVRR